MGSKLKSSIKKPREFSIRKARRLQKQLAERVITKDCLPSTLKYVAGIDVSYFKKLAIAAIVVLNYDSLEVVEVESSTCKESFPYIPTLLSFREVPAAFKVLPKLEKKPDVYLVDGQGLAHPFRCGLATHIGVVKNIPTIGVAKSRLCGDVGNYTKEGLAPLIDDGELVGVALITQIGKKPLYVSIGHMVSLGRAIKIVKHCTRNYRISEPIRLAHKIVTREKKRMQRLKK